MKLKTARRQGIQLLLLVLLAACSTTPPSNHYILRAAGQPPDNDSGISLGVGPISVPDYLRRDNFVLSRDGNQLEIRQQERWAEPLEEGISRVLSLNLAGLLQTQDIRPYPWHPRRQPRFAVQVRVLALDADSGSARLTAEWLLLDPDSDAELQRRIAQLGQPLSSPEASAVAAAYSALLFSLSEQIASAVDSVLKQAE